MMTRTEIITRMCEITAGLADLRGQAEQLGVEMQNLMLEMQETDAG